VSFVRTVLGDVSAAQLGTCYSHEHVIIRGEFLKQEFPELILEDLSAITSELLALRGLGVATMIDAMPIDAGRSGRDLAEISRRTGIQIVAATGLHLRDYYPPLHWYDTIGEADLTERFVHEIDEEMEDNGHLSGVRAGVIKVAGGLDQLSDLEVRNFRAAGNAQKRTGCPILTHTEKGTAGLEQIRVLEESGADLAHVVLSHLDKNPDFAHHRKVLDKGVRLEFDSAFRWKGPNQTLELLLELAPEYPDSFVLGMDAAKSAYWTSYGGYPGLAFLIRDFVPLLRKRGMSEELIDNLFVRNPANAYGFGKRYEREFQE
jgi:predicted metal-dependent phosphotriesterase family hydrolase